MIILSSANFRTDCSAMDNSSNHGATAAVDDNVATGNNLPTSKDPQSSLSGIDIRQALDILSSRTPHTHDHDHAHAHDHHDTRCCGGGADNPSSAELKSMGQTIDLLAPSAVSSVDFSQSSSPSQTTNTTSISTTTTTTTITPIERRQKIRDSLRDLPFIALLKMVLTAQEDRVRTYRLYDEALRKVLLSNRLTDYPPACVAATAAFAVLSDTVAAVRDELSTRIENKTKNNDETVSLPSTSTLSSVIKSIGDLQASEREKLQLTAACHLEQIRANNLKQPNHDGDNDNDEGGDVDRRELSLLNNGIADLRSRIETCRSNINDIIEDLRCALVEQMEEEEEEE